MAHLVAHGGFNLCQSAALQQIVVQRNSLRAAEAADVGADPIRLLGRIEFVDIGGGDAVGARHAKNRILNSRILQLLVLIE